MSGRRVSWAPRALLPGGWADGVRITIGADGLIEAVEKGAEAEGAETLGGIVVPGAANLHSHAFQRAMAGLAERRGPTVDSFWTWREVMYRFLMALTPDDVEAIAAQLYVEMLEAGFTSVAEFHYLHHQADGSAYANPAEMAARIAAAAEASGIGLTMLPVHYAWGGVGKEPLKTGQRRFGTSMEMYARLVEGSRKAIAGLPGAALGLAPHSLRASAPEEIAEIVRMAGGAPVHIHAAEQPKEVADCLAILGARPVQWLLDNAPLDPRWCLIHATHTTPDELAPLAKTGATISLCPSTEASLGDGIFATPPYRWFDGRYGIGTDSHVGIDPAEELRILEYGQRLRDGARNVVAGETQSCGRVLYAEALRPARDVLARPVGGLAPGLRADLVVLDGGNPMLAGTTGDTTLDAWIFVAGSRAVKDVYVGGKRLVEGGRHVARERIAARAVPVLQRLRAG